MAVMIGETKAGATHFIEVWRSQGGEVMQTPEYQICLLEDILDITAKGRATTLFVWHIKPKKYKHYVK